ncbi:MAG: tryptophan-rich sensory protein [Clostridia bacterium]|nr:tryptophan-rich sensory protein [Clostridia bacterium]
MKPINLKRLIVAILIPEAVGFLSSFVTGNIGDAYGSYTKPPLSPPGIVFPIVWVILYALMGIASYIIYEEGKGETGREALIFYGLQLAVNFIWPIIFFRFEAYWVAVVVILILLVLVVITALKFREISTVAFWLMVPYIIWLLFATYLNIGVAVLN